MIEFNCSNCGESLTVPDDHAGRQGKCPHCGQIVAAPGTPAGGSTVCGSFLRLLKLSILASLLAPVVIFYCSKMTEKLPLTPEFIGVLAGMVALAAAVYAALNRWLRKAGTAIELVGQRQAGFLDKLDWRYVDLAVFASAGVSLFLELAVIRWQGTVFEFFAFYKNLGLLCAFAGLGLGYALAYRGSIPLLFTIPLLGYQMLLMIGLRHLPDINLLDSMLVTPFPEQLNMGFATATTGYHYVAVYSFISVIFFLTALAFVPVGQLCGRLMRRRENLRAYSWNLLGSLAGVLLVFLASYLQTGPVIWFAVSFLVILALQAFATRVLALGAACALAALAVLAFPVSSAWLPIYSPYQLIELGAGENKMVCLRAAGHYYQRINDLSKARVGAANDEKLTRTSQYYEFPYRAFGRPAKVAIVGAGTGNDVAAALRRDATAVDAIEIDPVIQQIGTRFHPERPYDDPRVRKIVNDARTHLRTTDETYDMVVYGLLDSHTLLSHASSVRLDSFVYTVEGLKEAAARLREGGVLSLSFCVLSDELGRKIYLMMQQAFGGRAPVCVKAGYDGSVIFLQAKGGDLSLPAGLLEECGFQDCAALYSDPKLQADVSTDDWPFFYMPKRIYPMSYVFLMGLVVLLAGLLTWNFFGQELRVGNGVFLLLGAGFMLVETKAITELGLTFGNTWHVIGIAIAGVLLMGFLANCLVRWVRFDRPWIPYALLLVALAAGFLVARGGGFPSTLWGRAATAAMLTCPLFASGVVFSALLRKSGDLPGAMASNLLGAMLGGILEYNSMYFGFQSLYLLAMGLYVLALLLTCVRPLKVSA